MGDCSWISDSRLYIETGGKLCRRWERRHCIFEHEKRGRPCFISEIKIQTGDLISYRTPHLDETDTNHVFEHSVLAFL